MTDKCDNCNKDILMEWEKTSDGEHYFCSDKCSLEFMNKEEEE